MRPRRRPFSPNEHLWCVINMRGLSAHERLIAHTLHSLCYVNNGSKKQASHEYLAHKCEISRSAVVRASYRVVEVGLFNRLDHREGGFRGKASAATYRPMVPSWWEARPGMVDELTFSTTD